MAINLFVTVLRKRRTHSPHFFFIFSPLKEDFLTLPEAGRVSEAFFL